MEDSEKGNIVNCLFYFTWYMEGLVNQGKVQFIIKEIGN